MIVYLTFANFVSCKCFTPRMQHFNMADCDKGFYRRLREEANVLFYKYPYI